MDPNETLEAIRKALTYADNASLAKGNVARELAMEGFRNLDQWLSNGGFLPDAWKGAWHDKT